jgi:hypothetical protein
MANTFGRCNLDGTGVESFSVPEGKDFRRFAIHSARSQIFWGDAGQGILVSGSTGGTADLVTDVSSGQVRGVALDPGSSKVYWVDGTYVRRANLDGSSVESLCQMSAQGEGIALDLVNHYIYVSRWIDGKILRIPMNGGTEQILISTGGMLEAIAVDPAGDAIYWLNGSAIQRARLDGSRVETVVSRSGGLYGLALDLNSKIMYWSTDTAIQKTAMLSIPRVIVTVVTNLSGANDLQLDMSPASSNVTGFTYQGRLKYQDTTPSGLFDFRFSLWADPTRQTTDYQLGSMQTWTGVEVLGGLFTVLLNEGGQFGPGAFCGGVRWLQVDVKGSGEVGFTPLAPRQRITPGPYVVVP